MPQGYRGTPEKGSYLWDRQTDRQTGSADEDSHVPRLQVEIRVGTILYSSVFDTQKSRKVKRPAVAENQTQDTWLELPYHWATTTGRPPALIILHRWY